MSKWYLARSGEVYGPYRLQQLQEMNLAGQLHPEDMFCLEGQQTWITHGVFVAEQCVPPEDKKRKVVKEKKAPAVPSAKQTAYLTFMGFPVPDTMAKAAELMDAIYENEQLKARRFEWMKARVQMYPDLYAEEAAKAVADNAEIRRGRAAALRDGINDDQSMDPESSPFKRISLKDAQVVVDYMDQLSPGWDIGQYGEQREVHESEIRQLLERALALRLPDKVKKGWEYLFGK